MYTWIDCNGIIRSTEKFPPAGRLIIEIDYHELTHHKKEEGDERQHCGRDSKEN